MTLASDNTPCDIEWEQLHIIGNDISRCAYLTLFGESDNVAIAEHDSKVKLYNPFKNMHHW